MQQVEIEFVHPKPHEGALAGGNGAPPRGVLRHHLADQEHLVLAPVDRLADEFFRTTIGIHFRRVDQRHAEVDA